MTPAQPPVTNYAELKFYSDIIVLFFVAGNTIYTWWSNRQKITAARFEALEKKVDSRLNKDDLKASEEDRDKSCIEHKGRTEALSKAYANLHIEVTRLPDRREITKLDNSIKDLAEKLGNVDGRLAGINRAVDLINQFLIEQGGKK